MPSIPLFLSCVPFPFAGNVPASCVEAPARWRRLAAALLILGAGTGIALAQEPSTLTPKTTQQWQALSEKLATRQATIVRKQAPSAALLRSRVAETEVAGAPVTAFNKIITDQMPVELPPADVAAAPDEEAAPPPSASPALVAGEIYRVPLNKDEDRLAAKVLNDQFAQHTKNRPVAAFPGVVRQLAAADQRPRPVDLKAFALAGKALTRDRASGEFSGSIRVGVADLSSLAEGLRLSAPMAFDVLEADLADPPQVTLDTTSPPLKTIRIRTMEVVEPFVVHVASRFELQGIPVTLRISPTLRIQTDRKAIQGFGLETTKVEVWTVGVAHPQGRAVRLRADPSAHFAQSSLRLDEDGHAETLLRSDAAGTVTLTASMAGLADADYALRFDRPWRTLAFSLAGGLVGGLIRVAPRLRPGIRLRHPAIALFVSVLIGALVFALAVLGVNVLPVEFTVRIGDVFVFAVSALGAWLGTAALRPIAA